MKRKKRSLSDRLAEETMKEKRQEDSEEENEYSYSESSDHEERQHKRRLVTKGALNLGEKYVGETVSKSEAFPDGLMGNTARREAVALPSSSAESSEEDSSEGVDLYDLNEAQKVVMISKRDEKKEKKKADHIRNQKKLVDVLGKNRIRFQKFMNGSNRIPLGDQYQEYIYPGESGTAMKHYQEGLTALLGRYLQLRANFEKQSTVFQAYDGQVEADVTEANVKAWLAQEEERMRDVNVELEVWGRRLSATTGGSHLRAVHKSVEEQVKESLRDMPRLEKRAQMKRFQQVIIGSEQYKQNDEVEGIYDDNDWYQELLRQIISQKAAVATGKETPQEMSRHFLQTRELRKHTKKTYVNKLSKDKTLNFDPIPKLVNFMPPQSIPTAPNRKELLASLFT